MPTEVLLLNPPSEHKIQRRYMCSYNAPNMLLPPQELIALGGILRELNINTVLIDAVADNISTKALVNRIKILKPKYIVSIQGFECFSEDIAVLDTIKEYFQDIKIILFGHYASLFPTEILEKSSVDIVVLGEPDLIFKDLILGLHQENSLLNVAGIAYRQDGEVIIQEGESRIQKSDLLPVPAYELLNHDNYFEPLLKSPLGLIQTARGCPYSCNYCVRTFGKKLTYRTADQILEEIKLLTVKYKIKSLRFIDDTFTANKKRVAEICEKIIKSGISIEWTCLSRLDTIDFDLIPLMKKAGCKRIYFGVESGSPKVLKYLNKDLDLDKSIEIIKACRKCNIETLAFFIVGAPVEEDIDFKKSIDFAIKADFDFITVSELILYPGTELFDKLRNEISFSLFPYNNSWINKDILLRNKKREKIFYRKFYFRRRYFFNSVNKFFKSPFEFSMNVLKLTLFILKNNNFKRSDYF